MEVPEQKLVLREALIETLGVEVVFTVKGILAAVPVALELATQPEAVVT
jgi:hypothetical protein